MIDLFFAPAEASSVRLDADFRRVEKLPRRAWAPDEAERLADLLTAELLTPGGAELCEPECRCPRRLRGVQAVALYEMAQVGGLFAMMGVGSGKTLVTFLAQAVLQGPRPVLFIPAELRGKTLREREVLRRHWKIPDFKLQSYEWLGRNQAAEWLEEYQPDPLVCDEAHHLSNVKDASVARRFDRYLKKYPARSVDLSGTFTKRSLHDYAHLLRSSLGAEVAPVPQAWDDLELWADALDERPRQFRRARPGALIALCDQVEADALRAGEDERVVARRAFRRRLTDTPGVVATRDNPVDASLRVAALREPPPSPVIDAAFERLRRKWELPDGHALVDAVDVDRHARSLSLGLVYTWDPWPPEPWLAARRAWGQHVREVLSRSRRLDSESQVEAEVEEAGRGPGWAELSEWRLVEPTFEPCTVPLWVCDSVLEFCAAWMEARKGLVWTEHVLFAEALARLTGAPYYGRGGLDAGGRPVEDHAAGRPGILSIDSCKQGRNLQAHALGLVMSFPSNGRDAEQLLGRFHRPGQEADEVLFELPCFSVEQVASFWQAEADARYIEGSTGGVQKILLAGHDVPPVSEVTRLPGWRWKK